MKIKEIIKKKIYNANIKNLLRNIIILESNPDYADNTKAVFDELIKQNFNKDHKIIWFVDNKDKFKDIEIKNVKFIQRDSRLKNRIICMYYNIFAKYIIDCNKYIDKYNKYQFRIHLTHGATIKMPKEYCKKVGNVDYIIQISDFFSDITASLFNVKKEKIVTTGFPRCDEFYKEKNNRFKLYKEIHRKKDIFWFPTYRNHKKFTKKREDNCHDFSKMPFGIPVIKSSDELIELNELLKKNEILLLIKLHPAEDDSHINELNLSNLKLIKENVFDENHTNLYQLLSIADALITDYSSVYYDFLLRKKPIGLAISDIEEYKKNVELLFDDYEKNIVGEYIYTFTDLKDFINNLSNNKDIKYKERLEKLKLYQKYDDGNSSKRVVDILINKMEEDKK